MRDAKPHNSDEDGALVAASRKGDLAAFECLVRRHQGRMLNIACRITGIYEDACEVVQDAFLAAHRGLGNFRGEARFTTWLTTITINLARNRLEQLRFRRKNEAFSLDDPLPGEDGDLPRDPPDRAPSPLDLVEQLGVREKLKGCIDALDTDFREVLVLRDLEEFSYEEIALVLRLHSGTVKSRLSRARESVKECLKKVVGVL
jgi:RNA polymerase sigma-70 factor (ECF subfamily)